MLFPMKGVEGHGENYTMRSFTMCNPSVPLIFAWLNQGRWDGQDM